MAKPLDYSACLGSGQSSVKFRPAPPPGARPLLPWQGSFVVTLSDSEGAVPAYAEMLRGVHPFTSFRAGSERRQILREVYPERSEGLSMTPSPATYLGEEWKDSAPRTKGLMLPRRVLPKGGLQGPPRSL